MREELAEKLANLPQQPGVYIMHDDQGRIIYVGKAVVLRNRVRSYFQSSRNHSPKVKAMVAKIADLEYIVTASEVEALILECNLIKKHRPRYNISLKDDKSYPYIKATVHEEYPRLYVTRRVIKDGARYFGPYTNVTAVHETLRLLKRIFPLRTCRHLTAERPCLQYHIKRCLAPCTGKVPVEAYRRMFAEVCLLLEGRSDNVIRSLKKRMLAAADGLKFELAAQLRDQLAAVEKVTEKQNIVTGSGDQDVVGVARSPVGTCVQVFFIRSGKLIGRDHFLLSGSEDEADAAVLAAFLQQYYSRAAFIPREVLLPCVVDDQDLIETWLTDSKQQRVAVAVPQRGTKHELVRMACGNAELLLKERAVFIADQEARTAGAVQELGQSLGIKPPQRLECFDISHIQGAETVASMVVFEAGRPKKNAYRRYKLQTVEGKPDDFRSMQEVVLRRYRKYEEPLPDLIVIDGGKGQLSSALEVIRGLGLTIPVIGLAKEFEYIFTEGESDPVILSRESRALFLLQSIRDEAHRFAITYHRKLRTKRNMVSVLDHIVGIGPARRRALWDCFGNIAAIRQASVEELAAAPGMNRPAAEAVYNFFKVQP